jgi:hypothetical protein
MFTEFGDNGHVVRDRDVHRAQYLDRKFHFEIVFNYHSLLYVADQKARMMRSYKPSLRALSLRRRAYDNGVATITRLATCIDQSAFH